MSEGKHENHPQQVVQDYLDALLFDAEETPEAPEPGVVAAEVPAGDEGAGGPSRAPDERPAAKGVEVTGDDAEARANAAMIAASEARVPVAEAPPPATTVEVPSDDAEARANAAMIAASEGQEPVANPTQVYRPAGVADEFNTVLVRMHGLRLAVPFDQVESVRHLKGLSLALERQLDWVLGRYASSTGPVRVVDTALWLIRDRYDPALARYEEALVLPGRRWALACDELLQSLRLRADEVSWNGNREQRPWLLGTCTRQRCFLVDVPALLAQFDAAFSVSAESRGIL